MPTKTYKLISSIFPPCLDIIHQLPTQSRITTFDYANRGPHGYSPPSMMSKLLEGEKFSLPKKASNRFRSNFEQKMQKPVKLMSSCDGLQRLRFNELLFSGDFNKRRFPSLVRQWMPLIGSLFFSSFNWTMEFLLR